jgi:hypothetical protein
MIVDTVAYINEAYASGKKILLEGANGALVYFKFPATAPFDTAAMQCTVPANHRIHSSNPRSWISTSALIHMSRRLLSPAVFLSSLPFSRYDASLGGCAVGIGLAPQKITGVIGIVKAYTTRVGEGGFFFFFFHVPPPEYLCMWIWCIFVLVCVLCSLHHRPLPYGANRQSGTASARPRTRVRHHDGPTASLWLARPRALSLPLWPVFNEHAPPA